MFDIVVTYSGNLLSGQVGPRHLSPLSVWSGHVGSGSVGGDLGTRSIASGTIGPNDLGSGSVLSGAIASGQIGHFHVASGRLDGFELGSGAIVSGRVASGQLGERHLAQNSLWSGHAGSGLLMGSVGGGVRGIASGTLGFHDIGSGAILSGLIGSGQIGNFHVSSGAITSGRLGATGTPASGNVLQADFSWIAPTGGKWVRLSTATASASATVDFTLPAGYAAYKIELSHVAPATDNTTLWIRTSTDGGSTYDAAASDYQWTGIGSNNAGAVTTYDAADSEIEIAANAGNAANETGSGEVFIFNPSAAQYGSLQAVLGYHNINGVLVTLFTTGRRLAAADVNAIRFMFSSGNIASGQFDLYGLST